MKVLCSTTIVNVVLLASYFPTNNGKGLFRLLVNRGAMEDITFGDFRDELKSGATNVRSKGNERPETDETDKSHMCVV